MRFMRLQALIVSTAALLVGLPLAGVWLSGKDVGPYLHFPPQTGYVQHAPFNSLIFCCGLFLFFVVFGFIYSLLRPALSLKRDLPFRRFPWWGIGGTVLMITSWILAWNRFGWFHPFQAYTFFPLWLGYILSVNGVTCWLSGHCLLTEKPGRFLLLFPLSSLFWWYFEWLNRFVQNWYYAGVEGFSAAGYILHATLCFSTVLPAVQATSELLVFLLEKDKISGPRIIFFTGKRIGWVLIISMASVLLALPMAPDLLFPFVWISPLFLVTGMELVAHKKTIFHPLGQGNWGPILIPALAALICGFFWEMWNWKSLAHWEYSIPYVDCWHIFEMPILGYLGYLPFGLQCHTIGKLSMSFLVAE